MSLLEKISNLKIFHILDSYKKVRCSGCLKKLKWSEISIIGPGTLCWCEGCRGGANLAGIIYWKLIEDENYKDAFKFCDGDLVKGNELSLSLLCL